MKTIAGIPRGFFSPRRLRLSAVLIVVSMVTSGWHQIPVLGVAYLGGRAGDDVRDCEFRLFRYCILLTFELEAELTPKEPEHFTD